MAALLFAGGGSIQNPQGDGWITWAIRPAFEQWPLLALFPGVLNIVVGWAIPLWLVRNSWLITKREREVLAREHEAGGPLPVQPPPFWWHY